MKRDDAKQLVTDGLAQLNEALSQGRSETLEKYLTVMSRFHRYSFGNLILILSQCSKTVRETEAEAVAFVVCHAFGLDSKTRSSDYIQLYRGTTETLAESLEYIQKTAAAIIEAISAVEPECGHTRPEQEAA